MLTALEKKIKKEHLPVLFIVCLLCGLLHYAELLSFLVGFYGDLSELTPLGRGRLISLLQHRLAVLRNVEGHNLLGLARRCAAHQTFAVRLQHCHLVSESNLSLNTDHRLKREVFLDGLRHRPAGRFPPIPERCSYSAAGRVRSAPTDRQIHLQGDIEWNNVNLQRSTSN